MWQAVKRSYKDAWAFVRAFPLLVGVVVFLEGAQHMVEWLAGFYAAGDGVMMALRAPGRLLLGGLKVMGVLAVGYWVCRYLLSDGSRRFTLAADLGAVRHYGIATLAYVLLSALTIGILAIASNLLFARQPLPLIVLGLLVAGALIRVCLSLWITGAAIGDLRGGLVHSIRHARGTMLWGIGVMIVAYLPIIAAHYALGFGAIGRSPLVAATMLAIDTGVVGFLAALIASAQVQVARRAAFRNGFDLARPAVTALATTR